MKVSGVHIPLGGKLCKQYEHNNSHLKFILDNTIFVWPSWFEINWLFCFCCFLFPK